MRNTYYIKIRTYAVAIADLVHLPEAKTPGWLITRINVPTEWRRLNHGTKLLTMILDDADREDEYLYLEPSPGGGLTYRQLVDWYTRHGFVMQPDGYMARKPHN